MQFVLLMCAGLHILQMSLCQCMENFWNAPFSVGPEPVSGRGEPREAGGVISVTHEPRGESSPPFAAILSSPFILSLLLLFLAGLPMFPSSAPLRLPSALTWRHRHSRAAPLRDVELSLLFSLLCSGYTDFIYVYLMQISLLFSFSH